MGEPPPAAAAEERVKRALVGIAALVLVVGPSALAASPQIDARVDPANPRFGDSFDYVVTATVDGSLVDSARIVNDLAPFTRVASTVERRSVTDGVGHITVSETIACLAAACLQGRPGVAVALPRASVVAGGEVAVSPRVKVAVGSRVTTAAVKASEPAFRRPEDLPGATYGVSPSLAAALFAVLGIGLLAGCAIVLTAPLRRERAGPRRALRVDERERAVRLLRESATRDAEDRRRAASLASRVVREPELARSAAGIAWSRPEPGPPDATTLADRVEHADGRVA
jgi:hypothetical protein